MQIQFRTTVIAERNGRVSQVAKKCREKAMKYLSALNGVCGLRAFSKVVLRFFGFFFSFLFFSKLVRSTERSANVQRDEGARMEKKNRTGVG